MKANRKILYTILLVSLVILASVSSFFLYYFYKMRNDNLSFNKIDIQESFVFMQNNYGSINELIKRIDSKKKVYSKEERELMSLKEELFNTRNTAGHQKSNANIEINKKNSEGEFDLSEFLPMNTKALLEMKKSYGFYLNKFLMEYARMKKLNTTIYREKIQRCYKTLNSITSELCACVENLLSSMDMYSSSNNWETPKGDEIIDKPKVKNEKKDEKKEEKIEEKNEEKKDGNEIKKENEDNKINENNKINKNEEQQGENKINENEDKNNEKKLNQNGKENKNNEKNSLEESGFNLIKDDNNTNNENNKK